MSGWLYILECSDGSYYVGSTRNIEHRISQHIIGKGSKYTAKRKPVKLVFACEFPTITEAYNLEKQVQGWSHAKREALIRAEFDKLPELARKNWVKYFNKTGD